MDDQRVESKELNRHNLSEYIVDVAVSKFLNRQDLVNIFREMAMIKFQILPDQLNEYLIYIPTHQELSPLSIVKLLRGQCPSTLIEDVNLSFYDLNNNNIVVF